ncbi:MAG: tandem-95 repeat protein [Gammaproteobacteria bacterium]|nr:tandem-95 repeat protein [Gammaproteobacteria bacterium]
MKPTQFKLTKIISALGLIPLAMSVNASDSKLYNDWLKVEEQSEYRSSLGNTESLPSTVFQLSAGALNGINKSNTDTFSITLPLPNNERVEFILKENNVFPKELQKKYPQIRSFSGYAKDNHEVTGRFEFSHKGLSAMFLQDEEWIFIDPIYDTKGLHRVYNGSLARTLVNFKPNDKVLFDAIENDKKANNQNRAPDFGDQLRSYRIAVSAAAEYTAFHGGSVADGLAAINVTINRVNEVYNRDLAVQLNLVAGNDQLVFTDAATDPFDNDTGDISTNQSVIDAAIGNANYDIGHIVNTAGGGLASLGVVCNNSAKARGVTGLGSPTGDVFYIDYVAHEIGHQFRGNHTFNGGTGSCGPNRAGSAAYEPGSGSTIMSYAGICGEQNLQNNSDAFFHTYSIDEIRSFITSGGGSSCGTLSSLSNNPPTVNAGENIVIPSQTPFILAGSGSDSDAADVPNLAYSWEQLDLGNQTPDQASMIDDGSRPLFRTFLPESSSTRYFPKLEKIVNGTSSFDEVLPTTDRVMNFRLTVRDDRGGVSSDDMTVTSVAAAGPFTVTAPSNAGPFTGGQPTTVTWNVANTSGGSVACPFVDIRLSSDGGATFTQTLVTATANDGSADAVMPNASIASARLMVICSDERFYNLNPIAFSIEASNGVPTITGQQDITTLEDQSVAIDATDLIIEDSDNSSPSDFTVTVYSGANYTFSGTTVTPAQDFNGSLLVNVSVNDGINESILFPLTVDVTSVNDAPVITAADSLSTDEDIPLTINVSDVTISDVDSTVFSLIINTGANYSVNGNQQVVPAANFSGNLTVGVRASDGESSSAAFDVSVTVNSVNDVPTVGDDSYTVVQDSGMTVLDVLSNDSDVDTGDTISISSINYAGNSTVTIDATSNEINYTPANGFSGQESFTYVVVDNNGGENTGTVSITVTSTSGGGGGGSMGVWTLLLALLCFNRKRKLV